MHQPIVSVLHDFSVMEISKEKSNRTITIHFLSSFHQFFSTEYTKHLFNVHDLTLKEKCLLVKPIKSIHFQKEQILQILFRITLPQQTIFFAKKTCGELLHFKCYSQLFSKKSQFFCPWKCNISCIYKMTVLNNQPWLKKIMLYLLQ